MRRLSLRLFSLWRHLVIKERNVAAHLVTKMDMWNEASVATSLGYRESAARLVKGQSVAVTGGEGQGWMAHVVGLVARLPECLYRVELADGRHMAKLESELEPLGGDRR